MKDIGIGLMILVSVAVYLSVFVFVGYKIAKHTIHKEIAMIGGFFCGIFILGLAFYLLG